MKKRNPIVISMGDPAGVGPEVIHGALKRAKALASRDVIVVGDVVSYARSVGESTELHGYHIVPYEDFLVASADMMREFERVGKGKRKPYFLDLGVGDGGIDLGEGSAASGAVAVSALSAAVDLLEHGSVDTLVTGPISKLWAREAGFDFAGHTEFLGSLFGGQPVMLFVGGGLKVALVTIHVPLKDVRELVTYERVESIIRAVTLTLQHDFAIDSPRIAVCGLNPHAGENGRIGNHDQQVVEPVIRDLKKEGYDVSGPHASDTVFLRAAMDQSYDAVVAMYHDQGLIPAKLLSCGEAVNVTANLSVIRTSPDHGTAYDIAGKGMARADSMLAAIELADAISRRREGEDVPPCPIELPINLSALKPPRGSRRHKAVPAP
ncbi:MAG: 4-hydroxythreonine-4-phosphate dehydrogenase PdxA [Planctomycetes bacterium]|nr:4-hydroxythreonine-4-phosphate dehydrogenase PdxA [Planctomycetota bacterium]NUQ35703.1 4-hydroxythreonine-4-phosphate dehydrogenase PdxA [Planctomycetaceae bacterium]